MDEVMQADEAVAEVEEVVEETTESTEEPTAEDSLQELIAKVAELERRTARISELDAIKSSMGRIPALQREVDKFKNTSTFVDPRVDGVEDILLSVIEDLEENLSDGTKRKLLTRQQARQQQQMLNELKKALPQAETSEEADTGVDPLWSAATTELLSEARRMGIDTNDPRIQWADPEDQNRGVFAAMERVRANFRTIADAEKAPERVVARKAAAKPAPGSAGPTRSPEEILADESVPFAERMKVLAQLTK